MAGGNKKSCGGEVLSGRGTFEQLHAGVLINLKPYAIVLTQSP